MNKKHVCKYCGKEFSSGQSLGAHIICCDKNPNSHKKDFIKKKKINKDNKNPILEIELECKICKKKYRMNIRKNDFELGKYKKTCSRKCASKLSAINTNLETKNKNISNAFFVLKENNKKYRKCEYCGKTFEIENKSKTSFCCEECRNKSKRYKLSISAKNRNFGGYNEKSIKKHHKGNYKGIHCDSSWELAYVVWCLDHNINIKRYSGFRTYIYNDKKHKYFPDFVIDETVIIEVKGYLDEISKIKLEQNTDIKLLSKIDLQEPLEYVKNKYGVNFWEVLYEK
jgi:hypothetical protein